MKISVLVGHGKAKNGGHDPGACANGYQEFEIAKQIAPAIEERLRMFYDVDTELINVKGDKTLNDRINMYMTKQSTDLIVEVHLNSFKNASATGTEVWHYPGSSDGKAVATEVSAWLSKLFGITNRGAKATNKNQFGIVDKTLPTAVLVETCFISNPKDVAHVNTTTECREAGYCIADAIAKAMKLKRVGGTTTVDTSVVDALQKQLKEKDATISALTAKIKAAQSALK